MGSEVELKLAIRSSIDAVFNLVLNMSSVGESDIVWERVPCFGRCITESSRTGDGNSPVLFKYTLMTSG